MTPGAQTVVLLRRDDDEDGQMTVVERVTVTGCSVQPQPAAETYDRGQSIRQRVRVFAPPGALAAARARDALEVDGWLVGRDGPVVMPLEGGPSVWPDPDGGPHHVELVVTHSAG